MNPPSVLSLPQSDDAIRNLKASESVVAAFQAAGFPSPPGELAQIATTFVRSQTLQIPINQVANMSAGSGQLGAAAAQGVNLLIGLMTPMQREAMKAGVNPLDPAAVLRFNALLNGPAMGSAIAARTMVDAGEARSGTGIATDGDRPTSASYTQELAGGATYKALTGQGYAPAHVTSAIDFARHIGASDDMARKFIKLDQPNRDNLHRFVNDMRSNNQHLSEAEQKEKIAKFRKENPDIGKTLTDQDILGIIRGKSKSDVKLEGEQRTAHDYKQSTLSEKQRALGIDTQIEARHQGTIAQLIRKPEINAAEDAELAAIAKRHTSHDVIPSPKKADAFDAKGSPSKHASRSAPTPKVT